MTPHNLDEAMNGSYNPVSRYYSNRFRSRFINCLNIPNHETPQSDRPVDLSYRGTGEENRQDGQDLEGVERVVNEAAKNLIW